MSGRPLQDLDKIEEKGRMTLSAGQARALVAGVVVLLALAVILGVQAGRIWSPPEVEPVGPNVASADRSIAEILEAYESRGDGLAGVETETETERSDVSAETESETEIAIEPPTPEPPTPEPLTPTDPLAGLPPTRPTGSFSVQLAAYPSHAEADQLVATIQGAGIDAYSMQAEVNGSTWYRVRVGRFSSRGDATAWLAALGQYTPFDPIVVRE